MAPEDILRSCKTSVESFKMKLWRNDGQLYLIILDVCITVGMKAVFKNNIFSLFEMTETFSRGQKHYLGHTDNTCELAFDHLPNSCLHKAKKFS